MVIYVGEHVWRLLCSKLKYTESNGKMLKVLLPLFQITTPRDVFQVFRKSVFDNEYNLSILCVIDIDGIYLCLLINITRINNDP